MERTNHKQQAAMRTILRVLARIGGSVIGLLAGGVVLLYGVLGSLSLLTGPWEEDNALGGLIFIGGLAFLVGTVPGAAVGATITQRLMKQRSSFSRALLGALVGTVLPGIGTVLGAVISSGWKAKAAAEAQS